MCPMCKQIYIDLLRFTLAATPNPSCGPGDRSAAEDPSLHSEAMLHLNGRQISTGTGHMGKVWWRHACLARCSGTCRLWRACYSVGKTWLIWFDKSHFIGCLRNIGHMKDMLGYTQLELFLRTWKVQYVWVFHACDGTHAFVVWHLLFRSWRCGIVKINLPFYYWVG